MPFRWKTLLTKAGLLIGPAGTRRSTYSFRHTYATFRLMEGVDVYFLAKQMGTSVKMIEDFYGPHHPDEKCRAHFAGYGRMGTAGRRIRRMKPAA